MWAPRHCPEAAVTIIRHPAGLGEPEELIPVTCFPFGKEVMDFLGLGPVRMLPTARSPVAPLDSTGPVDQDEIRASATST